jgi:CRISPR-associated exonuclease Cas4
MDFSENEIIPISAISHHLYCPRQNALIHVEGVFMDNALTVSGNIGHEFIDEVQSIEDHGLHKETSLRVYSDRLGISGIADIVEFPEDASPFPIDYKNGKIASWANHEAQLCAIALCLEEMLQAEIRTGAIYHINSKKRHTVIFDEDLRNISLNAILEIREILMTKTIPDITDNKKLCKMCSLRDYCLPEAFSKKEINIFQAIDFG